MDSLKKRRAFLVALCVGLLVGVAYAVSSRDGEGVQQDVQPTLVDPTMKGASDDGEDSQDESLTRESSIEEVLSLAGEAMSTMESSLTDYSARFLKQERNDSGVLDEATEMSIKVMPRVRNETNDAPMRIYLKFLQPKVNAGREVIWGRDLYDGKMAVHETTLLLSWKTIWLDPTGMLAMAGQKFPIYELGLVRLVEQLIERGLKDAGNPDVSVTITKEHSFDGRTCELIQVRRSKPSDDSDDFSLAEVVYDPEQLLILSYRSFGWADSGGAGKTNELPLLESYEYLDLKTNIGLGESDFDVTNSSYGFP